jgi:catechol 2,3-dioxygenase-like lactoylglutathione lyase family enzyme
MEEPMSGHVKHLDHLNMTVASFGDTVDWYGRVFGFEVVEEGLQNGRPWGVLRAGEALLCVYEAPQRTTPPHWTEPEGIHRVHHFGLRITDREAWEATVTREALPVRYGGAYEWPHSTSWYVTDPSGHEIEVALWRDDAVRFDPVEERAA